MRNAMARYEADADAPCSQPLEFLLRSLARLEEGRLDAAQDDARRGRGATRDRVAGHLLFAAGAYGEGLDVLTESGVAASLCLRLAQELGWTLDALRILESPDASALYRRSAADLYARGGHTRRAMEIAADALKSSPDDAELALLFASAAPPEQQARARRSLEGLPLLASDLGRRCALALRALGGDARPQLEHCAKSKALDIADPARAQLARIAFEDGDDVRAREWCAQVRDFEGKGQEAQVVLGALALETGDEASAERIFARASKNEVSPFLLSWWAELYLRQERFEDARAVLHRSRLHGGALAGTLALQRLFLAVSTVERGQTLGAHRFREVEAVLRHFGEASRVDEVFAGPHAESVASLTSVVLKKLGRRRSMPPELVFTGARSGLRRAIERIVVLGDGALATFDEDAKAHGWGGALMRAHRGELLMWLGHYDEASTELDAAIAEDPRTRWAYIGLSALALQRGDAEEALRLNDDGIRAMGGTIGGSVHIHRGEALRLLGRHVEAKEALVQALQLHPARISASLNLALLAHATGDERLGVSMLNRLREQAPGLLSDARRQLEGPVTDAHILREALAMLGANRSSTCMSYVATTPRGPLRRFVQRPRAGAPNQASIADGERERLRAVLGLEAPGSKASGVEVVSGPTGALGSAIDAPLTSTQTQALGDHFVKHGYCVLRGGFSRDLALEWVRSATARVRAQPDVFVKGYHPSSPPLWGFDGRDPSTWTWERIELLAQRHLTYESFSPKLWGVLQNIAGPSLETKKLSDYFVLNLREDHGLVARASDAHGWHVDDPSAAMSLETLRNGLVLVMLFSDCAKGEGGTLLLEGSVDLVARHLDQHPEGVDLSDASLVRSIADGREDFTQVYGAAGDVYICSSLLLHTSAPNSSGRIRWMANPMLHLSEPPRLVGDESTPLEKSLRRALEP
ncbi:MAG: tetratricopeptide (TPR) repeat protein [Polyangiales bacterium]|jgi:tetratricopeptide (TPR) repeat protein